MKKIKALVIMCLVFSLTFSMTAFAKEQPAEELAVAENVGGVGTNSSGEDVAVPAFNAIVAVKSGTISGGYGEVDVTLSKKVSYGGIKAAVATGNSSDLVVCAVQFPSGNIHNLGTIPIRAGSATVITPAYSLSTGTYKFIFEASTTSSFVATGYIYE